jgi:hypothetical protein
MLEAQVEEGPGSLIGVEPRAFRASRLGGEAAGSLCLFARALSSVPELVLTFSFQGRTYRLFYCARCAALVLICSECDCGHRYCSEEHSKEARRQKHAQAQANYQRKHHKEWRVAHREHQKSYRERERAEQRRRSASGVTDQSLEKPATQINVSVHAPTPAATDANEPAVEARFRDKPMCCMFCRNVLAPFAGVHVWRWSG